MPMKFTFHENLEIVVCIWTGPITDKDLIPAYKKLYEDKKWKPGFSKITDVRDAELSKITISGLMSLAKNAESYAKGKANKSAVIVPNELADKLTLFYEAYTSSSSSSQIAKVFYNLSDALKWFGSKNINKEVLGLKE